LSEVLAYRRRQNLYAKNTKGLQELQRAVTVPAILIMKPILVFPAPSALETPKSV
jgi:hypothetical protein